jgi:hypothetical protein
VSDVFVARLATKECFYNCKEAMWVRTEVELSNSGLCVSIPTSPTTFRFFRLTEREAKFEGICLCDYQVHGPILSFQSKKPEKTRMSDAQKFGAMATIDPASEQHRYVPTRTRNPKLGEAILFT